MRNQVRSPRGLYWALLGAAVLVAGSATVSPAEEDFGALVKRLEGEKPAFAKRHLELLTARYDLADRPAAGVTMSRGKPVQEGVRVRLPKDLTWEKLAALSPEEIKTRGLLAGGVLSRCRTRTTKRAAWSSRSRSSTRPSARPGAT